jgi:hypothetical protein
MKGTITDPAVLGAVQPHDLTAYLHAHGWRPLPASPDDPLADWVTETDAGGIEVSVPRHPGWRDYARRVRDILEGLSRAERRSELLIIQDIGSVSKDCVRFRAVVDGRNDGTIPLEAGARLARSARRLMMAAACAAEAPRRAYHARRSPAVVNYLAGLNLGQTEPGSFVMTVMSPVPPALAPAAAPAVTDPQDASFPRRVTRALATALSAVRQAAEASVVAGDATPFEASVDRGVSADLCEALALIRHGGSISQLDIDIRWAPSRREPPELPVRHEFSPDMLDVLREAGRVLRGTRPVEGFDIEGVVVALDRPKHDRAGHAGVVTTVDGRPRKVWIEIAGEDWDQAIEAMRRRVVVRYRGELVRQGRSYVLRNPRHPSDPAEPGVRTS